FNILDLFGQRVEVYRDLRRGQNCWSLRSPETKLVLDYEGTGRNRIKVKIQEVALRDCVFKVQKGGPGRVRRNKRKDVHAWVVGTIVDPVEVRKFCMIEVTYNPFK